MKYFADKVIKPYVAEAGYHHVCEIGASFGENSDKLLEIEDINLTIVDPCLDLDLVGKYSGNKRVTVHKGISLDVIPKLQGSFDCILIDGDHNWFTVFNELQMIQSKGLLKPGGTIFFHDVAWPYGRRDMYFQPELIPPEFVLPSEKKGIVEGLSELSDSGINGQFLTAKYEGGSRNGVLTAVEDFLKANKGQYKFFHIEVENGLGVLLNAKGLIGNTVFQKYRLRKKFSGWRKNLTGKSS